MTKLTKKNRMATFCIIKSYSVKQNFISRHSFEQMWLHDNSKADVYTEADIIIKKDDNHLFQVDLIVDVSAIESITLRNIFDIHIIYTSLVFIDETVSEQERDKILMVDVPNITFPSVQEMIKQMTENAGYNRLSIDAIDFEHRLRCNQRIVNEE